MGIMLGELIQCAKSEKELVARKDFIHVFDFLDEPMEHGQRSGALSNELLRKEKSAGPVAT
jgi:hypothetical protein